MILQFRAKIKNGMASRNWKIFYRLGSPLLWMLVQKR